MSYLTTQLGGFLLVGGWSGDCREGCAVGIFFEGSSLHDTFLSTGIWVVFSRFKILSDKGQEYWCSRALTEKDSHNLETKITTKKGKKVGITSYQGRKASSPWPLLDGKTHYVHTNHRDTCKYCQNFPQEAWGGPFPTHEQLLS